MGKGEKGNSISDLVVINFLEMKIKGFKINFFPSFFFGDEIYFKTFDFHLQKVDNHQI